MVLKFGGQLNKSLCILKFPANKTTSLKYVPESGKIKFAAQNISAAQLFVRPSHCSGQLYMWAELYKLVFPTAALISVLTDGNQFIDLVPIFAAFL